MNFKEYETSRAVSTLFFKENDPVLLKLICGLTEETGEVAKKIRKEFPVSSIKEELGDVLWFVTKLAHHFGLSLEEVATANVQKLNDRIDRNVIVGEGDNR